MMFLMDLRPLVEQIMILLFYRDEVITESQAREIRLRWFKAGFEESVLSSVTSTMMTTAGELYEASDGVLHGERGPFLMAASIFHVVVQVKLYMTCVLSNPQTCPFLQFNYGEILIRTEGSELAGALLLVSVVHIVGFLVATFFSYTKANRVRVRVRVLLLHLWK